MEVDPTHMSMNRWMVSKCISTNLTLIIHKTNVELIN